VTTVPTPDSPDVPLRVLFVAPYYKPNWGGIERVIDQLSARLRADGHTTGILATHYAFPRRHLPGLAARETIDGGMAYYRVPSWPHRAPPFFSVPLVWFPPRSFGAVLDEFRPDIIHWVGDGWFWGHLWTWYRGRRRAAIVFTPSFHRLIPAYRWLQPINILLCRAADRITVLSGLERAAVSRTYLAPRGRLATLGWGIAAPASDGTPPRGWAADCLTLLCVGRLGAHKGQEWTLDRLLAARTRLPQGVAARLRLVLVGRDEGGEAALRARIARAGLDDLVLLTGEVDDAELLRWYDHADLFVLFSRYEAFGLALVEALAHGLPALTHAVGATAEIAPDGCGAIVVPPFDAAAAEDALVALLASERARVALGHAGRAFAARYAWTQVAQRFVAIYRQALARHARRHRCVAGTTNRKGR
jgi:glycosyltransferase involved in cell wall biosynthesis